MCSGPTSSQTDVSNEENAMMKVLQSAYQTEFGEDQQIFKQAMQVFEPIAAAGPDQQQPADVTAAERTQSMEAASTAAGQASATIGNELASRGGGQSFEPSGAEGELKSEIAIGAEKQNADEQQQITQKSYDVGRQNWLAAEQGMMNLPGVISGATGAGESVTGGEVAAGNQANTIAAQGNSWMGLLGGLAGSAATAYAGKP